MDELVKMNKRLIYIIFLIFVLSFNIFFIFSTRNSDIEQNLARFQGDSIQDSGFSVTNPPDLDLNSTDPTNHTISWDLMETFDYLGAYSFTEDADGADPAGWDLYT